MTLDVICDLAVEGDFKGSPDLLALLKKDNFFQNFPLTNYSVLSEDQEFLHLFFYTRYFPPIDDLRELASRFQGFSFTLTYDDQIGNDGKVRFSGGHESKLEYISDFRKELAELVSAGKLPQYGSVLSATDDEQLEEKVISYAEQFGFEFDEESDIWSALEWLDEYAGDFGTFETEDLSLIFRPWDHTDF
jgi:hypothetical protein